MEVAEPHRTVDCRSVLCVTRSLPPTNEALPSRVRGFAAQVFHVEPHNRAHTIAFRVGVSVGTPLIVLAATGHLNLALYACFGAMPSAYGRGLCHRPRAAMQCVAAILLTASVTLGAVVATSPYRDWLVLPAAAAIAIVGSVVSDRAGFRPPGPLFAVFALAAVAAVPISWSTVPLAAGVALAAGAFAVVIGVVSHAGHGPGTHDMRPGKQRRRPSLRSAGLYATAAVLGGIIPTATGLGHPYWSMVAAVSVLVGPGHRHRGVRATQRVLGTCAGLIVAAALLVVPPVPALTLATIIVFQTCIELFIARNYAFGLLFVTPMALTLTRLGPVANAEILIRDRLLETAIGVSIGLVTAWLFGLRSRTGSVTGPRLHGSREGSADRQPARSAGADHGPSDAGA